MTTRPRKPAAGPRYGPSSFVAALVTMLIVQTLTWVMVPLLPINLFVFGFLSAVVLPVALIASQTPGGLTPAVRGMLIGYLATPLTAAVTIVPTLVVILIRQALE
ncbi:MAG TPA: hypothetical protein VFQ37_14925 [Mycobacterium sp.]|nr:hypothetical protein [Mycobacterium sp.]